MRWVLGGFALLILLGFGVFGWRGMHSPRRPIYLFPDMKFQPRSPQQGQNDFFTDGRAMRTPPAGTVAFGGTDYASDAGRPEPNPDFLQEDAVYYRGKEGEAFVTRFPPRVKIDLVLMKRGQERYNIHCAVCHGGAADGSGVAAEYMGVKPAKLQDERIRNMPVGEIFNTVTNGKGQMQPYGHLVRPADRWAIIAYVRALQRSQNATLADVPGDKRAELEK